jgi:hypothetical protein
LRHRPCTYVDYCLRTGDDDVRRRGSFDHFRPPRSWNT